MLVPSLSSTVYLSSYLCESRMRSIMSGGKPSGVGQPWTIWEWISHLKVCLAISRSCLTCLSVVLAPQDIVISHTSSKSSSLSPVAALHAYISSLPTQTSIPTAITNLIRLLLLYTAKSRSSSHVLLGTSLTSLSISLISSIGQGGGVGVREEVGEVWSPGQTLGSDPEKKRTRIHINRPLREVGMKECAIWAWWNDLRVIGRDRFAGGKHGIGALTRGEIVVRYMCLLLLNVVHGIPADFIVGLEQDYPSTVSTIARTCGKLTPKVAILEEGETAGACCAWCERLVLWSNHSRCAKSTSQTNTTRYHGTVEESNSNQILWRHRYYLGSSPSRTSISPRIPSPFRRHGRPSRAQ